MPLPNQKGPLIIIKDKPVGELLLPKTVFRMGGKCTNCGRQFFVQVRNLTQITARTDEEAAEKEKALADWLQVKKKNICVDCWPRGFRNYIAIRGNMTYR